MKLTLEFNKHSMGRAAVKTVAATTFFTLIIVNAAMAGVGMATLSLTMGLGVPGLIVTTPFAIVIASYTANNLYKDIRKGMNKKLAKVDAKYAKAL